MSRVAIVHDYLTQRGGAERVVLAMARSFPETPIYTSLYEPDGTFPEFREISVRTSALDRVAVLRRNHRLALPMLAPMFSRMRIDADVALCSSSGWAHGVRTLGRKIVYCHAPARWLYQPRRYNAGASAVAGAVLRPWLVGWDRRAAASADCYVVNSTMVRDEVRRIYGLEAEVLHPPFGLGPDGPTEAVAGVDEGFFLLVGRFLPYKNIGAVTAAMMDLPEEQLVVVGEGPLADVLRRAAPSNVLFVGAIDDARLRWLYAHCRAAVSASYEDFGLVPLEAAAFGRPTAALRFGGFLDTIQDGRTGVLFGGPSPGDIAAAMRRLRTLSWDEAQLRAHAARFSEPAFRARLREIVSECAETE